MDDSPNSLPEKDRNGDPASQLPLWSEETALASELPLADESFPPSDDLSSTEPLQSPEGRPEPPWGFTDLGVFTALAALAFFLVNLTFAAATLALQRSLGWTRPLEELLMQTPLIILVQVVCSVVWFLLIYLTVTGKYKRPFWEAVRWQSMGRSIRAYFLAGIGLQIAVQAVFGLFQSREELPIERLFSSPTSAWLLALFGIGIAPLIEELIFRGFFYPVFERHWGLLRAVLLTALLFAAIHAPQLGGGVAEMLAIFCVGAALSYVRGRSGSLVPSYVMHLSYNASLFVALYLGTDGFRNLPG